MDAQAAVSAVQSGLAFVNAVRDFIVTDNIMEVQIRQDVLRILQVVTTYKELWMRAPTEADTLRRLDELERMLLRATNAGKGFFGSHVALILAEDDDAHVTVADLSAAIRKASLPGITRRQALSDRRFFVRAFTDLVKHVNVYIDERFPGKEAAKKVAQKIRVAFVNKDELKERLNQMLKKVRRKARAVTKEEKTSKTAEAVDEEDDSDEEDDGTDPTDDDSAPTGGDGAPASSGQVPVDVKTK